jgi:hypothetical protein
LPGTSVAVRAGYSAIPRVIFEFQRVAFEERPFLIIIELFKTTYRQLFEFKKKAATLYLSGIYDDFGIIIMAHSATE